MSEFGKFSQLTFVNGGPPPIDADNLNELERVVALTDLELARSQAVSFSEWTRYFLRRNTKYFYRFADLDPPSVWSEVYPTYVTISSETSDQIMGNNCLKMEIINAAASWLSIYQTLATPIDLSTFTDGGSSTTDDLLVIVCYISDISAFRYLQIRLGDDFANSYLIELIALAQTGWNAIYVQKSDFTTVGAPTGWNNIDYFRISPYSNAGYVGDYLLFNFVTMVRQDAVSAGQCNAFQKYMGAVTGWVNTFNVISDVCLLYYDWQDMIEQIGIMKIESEDEEAQLLLYESVIQFISKFEFICKEAGETASIVWYVDSSNFAEVYISSDTFYLSVVQGGGAPVVTSVALVNSLIKNEKIYIYFEKQDDTFRTILKKYGEPILTLEYETTISSDSDGDIYLAQSSTSSYSMLTDFVIGNKPINKLERELRPKYVRMQTAQNLVNNSMTNLLGLVVGLEPFNFYKIDLFLIVSCTNATPNVQVSWDITGGYVYCYRLAQGPAPSMTDASDCKIRSTYYGTGSNIEYGVELLGDESFIKETIIVLTEREAASIQIKGAQKNTDGGNPVTVLSNSFMIVTPLEPSAHENL